MKLNGWDHALEVTADGTGLVGHAGGLAEEGRRPGGLTAELSSALRGEGNVAAGRPGHRARVAAVGDHDRRDR